MMTNEVKNAKSDKAIKNKNIFIPRPQNSECATSTELNTFIFNNKSLSFQQWNNSAYKKLPNDLRSMASQFALMHYMRRYDFSSLQQLYPTLNQRKETTDNEIRNGDWVKRLSGTALSKTSYKNFNLATNYRCQRSLNHCLWILLHQHSMLLTETNKIFNLMPKQIRSQLLIRPIHKMVIFDDLRECIKQSYSQQRSALYLLCNIDGFTALLITAIFQIVFWNQTRPTTAEKLAEKAFVELFEVRYPLAKYDAMKVRINSLLNFYQEYKCNLISK